MPNIGDTKVARRGHTTEHYIWARCPECGKEQWIRVRNKYVHFGYCNSCSAKLFAPHGCLKGKHHTEESKQKMSLAKKGKPVAYITGHANFSREKNPFWGKHHSEETKEKLRLARLGKPSNRSSDYQHSEETKAKISAKAKERLTDKTKCPMYGKHLSEETRELISQKAKIRYEDARNHPHYGKKLSPEHEAKFSRLGWHHSEATKARIAKTMSLRWQNQNYVMKVLAGLNVKPNKLERRFIEICQRYNLPYMFNAATAELIIGGRVPDFINVNGKKEVIEIFGKRWHDKASNPDIHIQRTKQATVKHYKKYGFKCIVIWESEILHSNAEELMLAKLGNIQTSLAFVAKR